jgi:hypothetical protein
VSTQKGTILKVILVDFQNLLNGKIYRNSLPPPFFYHVSDSASVLFLVDGSNKQFPESPPETLLPTVHCVFHTISSSWRFCTVYWPVSQPLLISTFEDVLCYTWFYLCPYEFKWNVIVIVIPFYGYIFLQYNPGHIVCSLVFLFHSTSVSC